MRFPLGTSTNRQSRIRRGRITVTARENFSCNKIAREIFTQLMFTLRPKFSHCNVYGINNYDERGERGKKVVPFNVVYEYSNVAVSVVGFPIEILFIMEINVYF